ncbi:MAG TPA: cytochrome P450 [Blastocatellia bacterium]|nr:cytochrome P450 [Blastocatellia bacterium]
MSVASYPPGPKPRIPGSTIIKLRRDRLGFFTELARDYGDIAHFKVGPTDAFLVSHPDYIKEILVTRTRNFTKSRGLEMAKKVLGDGLLTSEGEFHLRQRRLVQPAFHRQRIAGYAAVMADYSMRMRERWTAGQTLDVWQEMMRVTLSIAGKTLFDADVEAEAREIGDAMRDLIRMFNRVTYPFADFLEKLPLPGNFKFIRARERLDSIIYRIIAERRASGEDRGDLLSMLLDAQDEEGGGDRMTDQQVRDEALTLFLAGHETTANALTWTWYLLSQNPDAQRRLHEEIDSVLAGSVPADADIPRLKYTEMVFAESMRMYPPAWTIGRRAIEDFELGGYLIPAKSSLLMSQYIVHRDPRFYPDPSRFDPLRWTAEARATRPAFSYFPFGGGPRICIGESFAWMEGVLVLAAVAQKWRLRLVPGHKVRMDPGITLRPKYGMRMQAECR